MAYTPNTPWQNLPTQTTPINADRLNHLENGLVQAALATDNNAAAIQSLIARVAKLEGTTSPTVGVAKSITLDAVGCRGLEYQSRPIKWAQDNGVKLIFTEVGIPSTLDGSKYDPRYNDVLTAWLNAAKNANVPWTVWGSAQWRIDLRAYSPSSDSTVGAGDLAYTSNVGTDLEPWLAYSNLNGVNLSGGEFGQNGQTLPTVPGTYNQDYYYPTAASINYLAGRGIKNIRVPFRWERLQHALGAALDATEAARFKTVLDAAASAGMTVIADMHNYGGYTVATGQQALLLGQNAPSGTAGGVTTITGGFVDFWTKFAAQFGTHPGLGGYGLMNEPHDLPSAADGSTTSGGDTWRQASSQAANALYAATKQTKNIYVSGYFYATASDWYNQNGQTPWLYNYPAGLSHALHYEPNVYFEAHMYFDDPNGGVYNVSYSDNVNQATNDCSNAGIPTTRTVQVNSSLTAPAIASDLPTGSGFVNVNSISGGSSTDMRNKMSGVGANTLTLPSGNYSVSDFYMYSHRDPNTASSSGYGLGLLLPSGAKGMIGQGPAFTTYSMVANTSTRSNEIPPDAYDANGNYLGAGTNQLYLLRVGNGTSSTSQTGTDQAVTLKNLTVAGTNQGHNYNGIQVYYAPGSLLDNVAFGGNYGTGDANPAETFAINVFHSSGSRFRNLNGDGGMHSSSIFAGNASDNLDVRNSTFTGQLHGYPVALFQCAGGVFTNVTTKGLDQNYMTSFNIERQTGTLELRQCTFSAGSGSHTSHVAIASDTGSAVVNIYDPVFNGSKFIVRVGSTYQGNPGKQNTSDIHLFIGGVERTSDMLSIIS